MKVMISLPLAISSKCLLQAYLVYASLLGLSEKDLLQARQGIWLLLMFMRMGDVFGKLVNVSD